MKNYIIIKEGLTDTSEAPRDRDIFYRCTDCEGIVPSVPRDSVGCSCGNITIDVDYNVLSVRDYTKFQAIKKQ